ncbi:MAG: SAM-dependent methyltransferase [Candidatus Aminicenantes bacterium]|nr:SAM-dependent methyltransferase [Candidatus Aminicenantes bacterium]
MKLSGSFRDPSGFLFVRDGVLYRQVNAPYRPHYDRLMESGLYAALTEAGLLVRHEEVDIPPADPAASPYKTIRPERIAFISYPYEWCFGQLKAAALATLKIQKKAAEFGMALKDASAYNMQFVDGKPVLIDTLSFERINGWAPWIAYRQFCQHFLAPLLLVARKDFRLAQLSRLFIDGVPLDLASALLPRSTRFRPGIATHIHAHAWSQRHYAKKQVQVRKRPITRAGYLGLIDSLETLVRKTEFRLAKTEWGAYYEETNYSDSAFACKKTLIEGFLDEIKPRTVWGLGANTGVFSRLASCRGIPTIAFDIDFVAVELNYREMRAKKEANLLPLVLDLTNPSPALGWAHEERASLIGRGPADTVFALALIHHLAISNNLPFDKIAAFFATVCRSLIIEFVPKSDSQVQKLLATREDIFPDYTPAGFEAAFGRRFRIRKIEKIADSERFLYLMDVPDASAR